MSQAEITLTNRQTEAYEYVFEDPIVNELGYGGAAGGGKTRLGCYISQIVAEKYPGSRFAIARKELKVLRLTTLAEMFQIFNELGYKKGIDYTFDAKDNIINYTNGSQVLLLDTAVSHDDPEYTRFGSLNLTGAWAEESNESPDKGIQILKTRIGRHNTFVIKGETVRVKPIWFETFNPNKGRVYREYYRAWKDGTLPEYRKFIRALPGDNPHLPPEYIENLKRADRITKERLLYGNFDFDDDPRKLMRYDYINDILTNTIKEKENKYLIADIARFGGDKIVFGLFRGFELYGLFIYRYQGIDQTTQIYKELLSEHAVPYSHALADEDGVGGGVVDNMRGTNGFMGNTRPFAIKERPINALIKQVPIQSNYINLRSQCFFELAESVNEHNFAVNLEHFDTNIPGYTQETAIAELLEELDVVKQTEYSGDSNKKLAIVPKSEMKELLGRSPDILDICMMRMYFKLKSKDERQPLIQNRLANHFERSRNIANNAR